MSRGSIWTVVAIMVAVTSISSAMAADAVAVRQGGLWVTCEGFDGPGKGKHVVLISGDEEYRSEEALTQLGKILARHHGFKCTVLFAVDPKSGAIDPTVPDSIPGLEALEKADLMIIATRFRDLPDEQMKYIDEYVASGKPIIGMRTATHAFKIAKGKTYERYSFDSTVEGWTDGFGRRILGETWINHHGHHGKQSSRGVVAPGMKDHPIVRGCEDIWGPTDVYTVRLPLPGDSKPLILGQVLEGMKPTDKPVSDRKNDPMMPVAWTRTYQGAKDKAGRVFTTTMGAATDLESEGLRRLLVNAAYWCLGMEDKIPPRANVEIVGEYRPSPFGFAGHKKGLKPADYAMKPAGR
jgi:type 1 glutamine amidotransferase